MTGAVSDVCARIAQAYFFDPLPDDELSMWEMASGGHPFYNPDDDKDPLVLVARAARGDLDAQRELAVMAAYLALSGSEDIDPQLTLAEGLMFARMAATHGDIRDSLLVINMLSLAAMLSTGETATEYAGEALGRIELLADTTGECGEIAAELLAKCAEHETPDALEKAKVWRARLAAEETE